MAQLAIFWGAIFGFMAVVLGAFGAHGLRARLDPEMLGIWKTATEYHFYHALALLLVGILARSLRSPGLDTASILFMAGIVVFSGSLYILALTGTRWLGAITPIGGILFLAGWSVLAWTAWRSQGIAS